MGTMTQDALLKLMKDHQVDVKPVQDSETVYDFDIEGHHFGHLDKFGNLYLDTFQEVISRPLSAGQKVLSRWIDWAIKGFKINLRRLEKWE